MTEKAPVTFAEALVAALAELTVVEKGSTANAGSYSYSYADIAAVVRATRPVLAAHGIVAMTPVHAFEGGLACTVVLLHTSGDRETFLPFPFPHGKDAQATGSMVTYHRRYALLSALGIATGDDDDGAGAAARPPAAASSTDEVRVPGFRTSVIDAMNALSKPEMTALRAWLAEESLPLDPTKWQPPTVDRVLEFILEGLPKVDDASGDPT